MFLLLFIIIIHEAGHLIAASILKYNNYKIIIYPFGGITKCEEKLNSSINKEMIVLLMGPIFQILLFLIIFLMFKNDLITQRIYELFYKINFLILNFNLLPILPLDGGRFLNLIFDKFFSYKSSHILTILISIITYFIILILIILFKFKIFYLLILLLLFKNILNEIFIHKYKFNKFLLERTLYNFNFKKKKNIKNIYKIKRNVSYKINGKDEKLIILEFLSKNQALNLT